MGELRAWKSRLTFKIRFQAVFWHELCFQGFPTAWFHVVAVQDSGLMELPLSCFLLEIGFEVFSWKTLPRLTFPVLLFSCLALWPNPPCDSCFILIIEKIRLSPVSGTTVKWGCPSQPLCWNCSAAWIPVLLCIHGSKKKSQIILTLNCENPGSISSHDTMLANFKQCHWTVCFYSEVAIYMYF